MAQLGYKPTTVPCAICGTPTTMTGTCRCDRCWELEGRIRRNPLLAVKILRDMGQGALVDNESDSVSAEREACAQACESLLSEDGINYVRDAMYGVAECAAAIRARGAK